MTTRPLPALALPIATPRLAIRDFRDSDLPAVVALYAERRVTRYLLQGPGTENGARRHLAGILRRQRQAGRENWELAVELAEDAQVIGACDLLLRSRAEAEIGYLLAPLCWGQGLGTEIAAALVKAAFEQLQVKRVLSTVEIHNSRSRKVLDKAGMRWDGTMKRYARAKRRWWDVHLYSVTREDWLHARS